MRRICLLAWLGMMPVWAGEMPEKAAGYHAALMKRPQSSQLFERFRDAWLEERSTQDLEQELLGRATAKEAGAWEILGRTYQAAGKPEQALEAFDKARERSPAAWLALETAGLHLAAKDFAAAEKDALAVPEGDPRRLDAVKLAGLACLRAERIDDALAYWTEALAAAPGDTGLLEDLIELTWREGRVDLAINYCGKWRDASADAYGRAMATLRRSELLLVSQRFDEAMTELGAVLAVSADDSWLERETLARAEQAYHQQGNVTGWAAWIGAKADEFPARLNFRRAQALAMAAVGKTDQALDLLTEVMKRSPGDTAVRWLRIGLLEQSMKLSQAYAECAELAAKEKSEAAGLRLAELAFRLEQKADLKRALDGVLAAADPAKRVGLAGLYERYGLHGESERIWREAAGGPQGGQALRQLGKQFHTAGRERDAIEAWKQLGAQDIAQDRIDAARMLAGAGERGLAREILTGGRRKFPADAGFEAALADLAMADAKPAEAREIYLKMARSSRQPDELAAATRGWLRSVATLPDPLAELGAETPDRCLRAAWLAAAGQPLPPIRDGDELERAARKSLLREHGRWPEVVEMMEAAPGARGPAFLSELAEAKTAAGDLPGALAAAREWRGRVPDQTEPWLFEAAALDKLGKPAEATVLLRRAAARFEDNEDVAKRLFAVLRESPDAREALEWAWKRHDRAPDEAARSSWLREILRASRESDQLADLKERFLERARRDPASPGPLVALAELAKASGDTRAELVSLRRAAINAPRDLAIISALASLEERSGETARALERYAELLRLAPGPVAARQLAQAKVRLGDIEGGMRDLQALAGEKGMDLRALEQSVGDLASRNYVEEAARLLAAVDPAQRSARLDFVLGALLEVDGREPEAADAYLRVIAEPDDPAENPHRSERGYDVANGSEFYTLLLQSYRGRYDWNSGVFTGLRVPQSLVEAKLFVKSRLFRLAIQHGGEAWTKAIFVIPGLAVATPEQWREALAFSQSGGSDYRQLWWDFIRDHPGNPLGVEMLAGSGQISRGTPEQVEAVLKTHPPLRIQMLLRLGSGNWRADSLEFLKSIGRADWQDGSIRNQALWLVERMFALASSEDAVTPVSASECARGLAVVGSAGFGDAEADRVTSLRTRLALLEENPDEFVRLVNAWTAGPRKPALQLFSLLPVFRIPVDAFGHWREKAGDEAALALIARIESPLLRCQLNFDPERAPRIAQVNRELAALPQDDPSEVRRGLIQWKWSLLERDKSNQVDFLKEMKAAADDPDPLLAFQAGLQLISAARRDGEFTVADRLKLQEPLARLAASPDAGDQATAAQYSGYFARYFSGSRPGTQAVATRWGAAANFSSGNSIRNRLALPAIIAMEDRELAAREAAKVLENTARASAGQSGTLSEIVKALSQARLLEDALARISLPPDAGLGRRLAHIALLDACAKPDRARALLEGIAKSRPWETSWTVNLALRSPEDAELGRLLDSVAERGDFDRILSELLVRRYNGVSDELLARLADWAPRDKGRRAWMETAMTLLARSKPAKDHAGLATFQRYVDMALDDRQLGELGFRMTLFPGHAATPEAVTEAARRALLSGAYTSEARAFSSTPMQGTQALAALEHLVLVARKSGDEAAFPPDFRARLKVVDPDSEAWIAALLAAKTTTELPDISDARAKSSGWVALARHEAAMLRVVNMPGRDAWLTGIFREKKAVSLSGNLQQVVRESLLEADKAGELPARVLALLEAAAGPRESWGEIVQVNATLSQAATYILGCAGKSDAATLLSVLDLYREEGVSAGDPTYVFNSLGQWWLQEMAPPRKATLAELLGGKRGAAFTLGVWQAARDSGGKPRFVWGLPLVLQNIRGTWLAEMAKSVKENPDAAFIELFQAGFGTSDRLLQRRALLTAAPDLAELPTGIRDGVTDFLTRSMGPADMQGLPDFAAARLGERLAAARKMRIAEARQTYQRLSSRPSARRSYEIGSMLGAVIADDEAFVAEVLAAWRPLAEKDASGGETQALAEGLVSSVGRGPGTAMMVLRLLDSLPPGAPAQQNANRGNPMDGPWSTLGLQAIADPEIWRQTAALTPGLQARFWVRAPAFSSSSGLVADPELLATLREAAHGGTVTRTALEWFLQSAESRSDRVSKIDGAVLLDYAKALKEAGTSASQLADLLGNSYTMLTRMDDPRAVMAETPALLAGLKSFPDEAGAKVFQGVENLWRQVRRDRPKSPADRLKSVEADPVYPVETAELLKFAFTRGVNPGRYGSYGPRLTQMMFATGDPELLDAWIRVGDGKSLVGDLTIIVWLLEKDRVAEAVALLPPVGQSFASSRSFDSHLESLIAKLSAIPNPQTFGLIARLSLLPDASGTESPAENYAARQTRLAEHFDRIRGTLTPSDRAGFCVALGLNRSLIQKHVPLLDEFASVAAAKDFQKLLASGESVTGLTTLFVPAVCSRVYAGDLSGISLLAGAIEAAPPGGRCENQISQYAIAPIQTSLADYAIRIDAMIPAASTEAILAYAKALAGRKNLSYLGIASHFVYLATTDRASLDANLKRCGLEGVAPTATYKSYPGSRETPEIAQTMIRVALLHPANSEALLESLAKPRTSDYYTSAILPALQEPKLRARISPALFLTWCRQLRRSNRPDLEAMNLYAAERRGDFDEDQRAELDGLLERLEDAAKPMNPARLEEMRRHYMEEQKSRWTREFMNLALPR